MRAPQGKSLRTYVPAFDGMRGLAAIGVVVAHCAAGHGKLSLLNSMVGLGSLGVDLFFALSGFLITGILLHVRNAGSPYRGVVRFCIRRALRICPVYFLAVAIYLALGNSGIRANVWWFATYTVNIGKAIGTTGWSPLNHFWTLSVEEQFYLLWPMLVVTCPRQRLGSVCLALAAASLVLRLMLRAIGANEFAVTQLTFVCIEPLALGGWFAVRESEGHSDAVLARTLARLGFLLTVMIMALPPGLQDVLGRASHALLFAPLLPIQKHTSGGAMRQILSSRPLRYIGAISYGLYVWHMPVIDAIHRLTPFGALTKEWPLPLIGITLFVLVLPSSLVVATLSWFTFERGFLRLKTYFE